MLLAAREGRPSLITEYRDILTKHISATMRDALAIPEPPQLDDTNSWLAAYRRTRTRFRAICKLIDPSPFPKNRRLSPDEFEHACRDLSPQQMELYSARLTFVANAVLEMSIAEIPAAVFARWKGSVGVDATPIPLFSRPPRTSGKGKNRVTLVHSADPDGGFYSRTADGQDANNLVDALDRKIKKRFWADEGTFVVTASDEPDEDKDFPHPLIIGMAPLHRPGVEPGENGVRALANVQSRGYPAGWLAADRAYSSSVPEKFQLPAKAMGYKVVFDYRSDQLGHQTTHEGAQQVDGQWYCPAMPEQIVLVTKEEAELERDLYEQRMQARENYALRRRGRPDANGDTRWACPAAGPSPTVTCPFKQNQQGTGLMPVFPSLLLEAKKPKICQQDTIMIPHSAGAKFGQELTYRSPDWHRLYAAIRNTNEGIHGIAKDGAYEALGVAERRRERGVAAQTLLVAFLLVGANLRMLDKFLTEATPDSDGVLRVPTKAPPPSRLRPALSDHLPQDIDIDRVL